MARSRKPSCGVSPYLPYQSNFLPSALLKSGWMIISSSSKVTLSIIINSTGEGAQFSAFSVPKPSFPPLLPTILLPNQPFRQTHVPLSYSVYIFSDQVPLYCPNFFDGLSELLFFPSLPFTLCGTLIFLCFIDLLPWASSLPNSSPTVPSFYRARI